MAEEDRGQHQFFLLLQKLRQEAIRVYIKTKSIQKQEIPRFSNGLDIWEVLLERRQRYLWKFDSRRKKNNGISKTLRPGKSSLDWRKIQQAELSVKAISPGRLEFSCFPLGELCLLIMFVLRLFFAGCTSYHGYKMYYVLHEPIKVWKSKDIWVHENLVEWFGKFFYKGKWNSHSVRYE